MVRRFLSIINREVRGLHEAAYILGFFSFLSQLLALVRDRMLASSFGAGQTLDIYYAAFRVPDLIFVSVASMVSISVLIPFLIDETEKGQQEIKSFLNSIFTAFSLLILIICGIVFILIPYLVPVILPGITNAAEETLLIHLARLLLLSPIFLGLSNLLASITQLYKRFFIYALCPIIYNAAIIFGIVFLRPHFGISGVVYGVVIGAFLHFALQLPFIIKEGLTPWFTTKIKWHEIKKVTLLSIPRTFTLSANNIALICVTSFASLMAAGSISIFNFSLNLQSVPLSIIGVSYSLAAFPTLAKLFSKGDKKKFVDQVTVAARHIIFLSLPVVALFIVLRAQIVRTVLGAGVFNWDSTRLTAAALALFTLSLMAQGLNLLFVRAYYASGNTRKPLIINLLTTIADIGFPYLLIIVFTHVPTFQYFIEALFKVEDVPGSVVLMLPLGYSLGEILNMLVFWWYFEKDFSHFSRRFFRTFRQTLGASCIMGFVTYLALPLFNKVFNVTTLIGIFLQGLCAGMIGIFVGIFILWLMKNEELHDMKHALNRKIFKTKDVVIEQEEMVS